MKDFTEYILKGAIFTTTLEDTYAWGLQDSVYLVGPWVKIRCREETWNLRSTNPSILALEVWSFLFFLGVYTALNKVWDPLMKKPAAEWLSECSKKWKCTNYKISGCHHETLVYTIDIFMYIYFLMYIVFTYAIYGNFIWIENAETLGRKSR